MLTGYLLAAAVATPIAGRLGDMLGKRRLFVASLLVFAAGNVVAALGDTLEVVVAGRVLQGIGGGIIPLAISIIRDEFPAERVPGSIGLISAIFGIGGGLGLVLGGVVTDALSYHWIFWIGAVVAALAALAAQLFVPESPVRTPGRVDVRGAALLAAGLVPPLFAISRANEWGWGSARTLGLIAAGVAVLAVFVVGGAPDGRAARRRPRALRAARADDQHHDAARRLRHVRLVHAHPAARRDAAGERLRLRPRRHGRRAAAAARVDRDALRRARVGLPGRPLRLQGAAGHRGRRDRRRALPASGSSTPRRRRSSRRT